MRLDYYNSGEILERKVIIMKKKIVSLILAGLMLLTAAPVFADSAADTYVALGADLSSAQRATVLELMGLTEDDLDSTHLVQITNAMEHEMLGSYLSDSVIGTRALSCVKVEKRNSGGINVTTKNISYCTEGMYKNALVTAGIENADVLVAAPMNISGTAGLVGAMEAYKQLTGESIDSESMDAAVDELVTTGELSDAIGSSEDAENLIAAVKQEIVTRDLKTDEDILKAIDDAAAELGITLSDSEKQLILDLMKKISKLNLDPEALKKQASDIYDRLKGLGVDLSNYDKQGFIDTLTGLFTKIIEFCKGLFG